MKVLILAGGYGTRLSEETDVLPKPMVDGANGELQREVSSTNR